MAGALRYRLCVYLVFVLSGVLGGVSKKPQNVALKRPCNISTVYEYDGFRNPCGAANNGNTGSSYQAGNCIHTDVGDQHPEWTVHLGQDYTIQRITIYARAHEVKRMSKVNVTINQRVVKTLPRCIRPGPNQCGFNANKFDVTLEPAVTGSRVTLEGPANKVNDQIHFLNICEVQVWACTTGTYTHGRACVRCGHCAGGDCSHLTGHCSTDCALGYTGRPFCQTKCDDHHYGRDCSQHCSAGCAGERCDNVNGHCDVTTCLPGYFQTPLCGDECDRYHYGTNCSRRCGAGCEGQTCDRTTGHCACRTGYLQSPSSMCDQGCADGHYGPDCDQTCGHCAHSEACNKIDGRCPAACDGDYTPPYCKSLPGQQKSGDTMTTGITVGGACVAAVIIVVVVVVVLVRLRRRASNQGHPCAGSEESGNSPPLRLSAPPRPEPREDEVPVEEDVYSHEDLYACYSTVTSRSLMDTFQKYLLNCLASSGKLVGEFEKFPQGMPHPHAVGSQPLNIVKNRFRSLCAYDHNRVILRRPAGDHDTDYINASYIKGCGNDQAYIATQGPRQHMVNDLWWMIWQEGATQVVMLTKLIEEGKNKCDEYWPPPGCTTTYGHVTVTSQEQSSKADYVIRTFSIQLKESSGQQQRTVHHYHYLAWPDHGVPAATSLVNFWRYVTARATTDAPPIIHCSAGVGRTGTYIALDIAISRKSRASDVTVKDIVNELREQRSIMVQTPAQYKFLHEVILEAYSSRDTRFPMDQLDVRFPSTIDPSKPNNSIDHEFKILKEMKQWAKPHHTTAELEENRDKNRDPSVLPDDDHLVYLSVHVRGRNQYINAVCMSTYTVNKGWLLTQLPLPHTTVDLWRLVEGCDVTTIVSLGGPNDERTDFCRYWPQSLHGVVTVGPFSVKLTVANRCTDHLTTFHLIVQHKNNTRAVTLLQYTDWAGEVPGSTSGLLHLMDTLTDTIGTSPSPVVIQCLDGTTRSGLLCTLYDVTARLKSDGQVDVLPTVRHVHTVLPTAVASQKQYRYCYRVAQDVKKSLSVYVNT